MGEAGLGHATEPFFTTKMIGTGMGLTLVQRIVEDHGGSLTVLNRSSGGVEAIIVLPQGAVRDTGRERREKGVKKKGGPGSMNPAPLACYETRLNEPA